MAETAPKPLQQPATCRDAVRSSWPSNLQEQALTVLVNENRRENPGAVGATNKNGSTDYGCFQINDAAHPQFFATSKWRDPVANAEYAYQVYKERKAIDGIGWTAWYAVDGILY